MKVGHIRATEDSDTDFHMDSVMEALVTLPESDEKRVILSQLGYVTYPYLISLSEEAIEGKSLMQDISDMNEKLQGAGLEFESYLQNMGRQLFRRTVFVYGCLRDCFLQG